MNDHLAEAIDRSIDWAVHAREKHHAFAAALGEMISPEPPHWRSGSTDALRYRKRHPEVGVEYTNAVKQMVDSARAGLWSKYLPTTQILDYFGVDAEQLRAVQVLIYG